MTDEKNADLFAYRVRLAREKREMSQGDVAEKSGLPASSISHFESGSRKPSIDNLNKLASALNVTTDYLLGRDEDNGTISAASNLDQHLNELTDNDLRLAEDFIRMLAERNRRQS